MEACYGGTDVMERSCAAARGKDINMYNAVIICWYVPDPRSRGATQIHHLEPRTLPAQGKRALP
jgi:hypothetical protein